MFWTANHYADAEEADQRHREDIARVPRPDRPVCRNDERLDEWRNDDRDNCYDDRECCFGGLF